MSIQSQTRVTQIANAFLFSQLSQTDLDYWSDQLDKEIYTPTSLALLATQTDLFKNENLPLATMYYTAFGTFATIQEVLLWRTIMQSGATITEIGTAFATSYEFDIANPTATLSDAARLDVLTSKTNTPIAQELKDAALIGLQKGTLTWGDVLLYITKLESKDLLVGLALLETAASGTVPDASRIDTLGTDLPTALSAIFTDNSLPPIESYSYTGTSWSDTITALSVPTAIRGMQGNDTLYGGDAQDTFIFESTPSTNGIDTLYNFQVGEEGDILDFSSFLNLPNVSTITTLSQTAASATPWQNGSILVVSGNALTTPDAVAALFGEAKPFASPTEASKAVIITADIIGDATVWFLINRLETQTIEPYELTKAATIKDLNNLSLVGLNETNFITESA